MLLSVLFLLLLLRAQREKPPGQVQRISLRAAQTAAGGASEKGVRCDRQSTRISESAPLAPAQSQIATPVVVFVAVVA